ncbi:hypothetical protein D0812_12880 [Vibrio owensii]|uniref:Uncharacterized protein n=1 Tax=Vibrio owensii TaxID=696485 RepID=A0ABN5Q0P7_9VIBR|nr:hypothetical protein [Vibrio owensii]AYO14390.1 hypothetical protein D0812_08225 [Vibrio owensii]AYO15262.1 hypothetical protein D0812_12880 [Vibrio owensii]
MTDSIEQRVAKLEEKAVLEKELVKWMHSTVEYLWGKEANRKAFPIESAEYEEAMTSASDYRARAAFLAGIFVGLIIAVFIFGN